MRKQLFKKQNNKGKEGGKVKYRLPGMSWNSLAQPVHTWQSNGLGRQMEHLRGLACTGFQDVQLGRMRSRVGADSAKKISEPSGSFDNSCPGIIMQDPCEYYSHYIDEEDERLMNEFGQLQLQNSSGQSCLEPLTLGSPHNPFYSISFSVSLLVDIL